MRLAILVAGLLALGSAAPAGAATIVQEPPRYTCQSGEKGCSPSPPTIAYVAAPGEANRLTVSADEGDVLLRDEVAITAAAPGCAAVDAMAVRCPAGRYFEARLGDGDDVADVASSGYGPSMPLDGGPGADRLTGTSVTGGEGDDTLIAPAGLSASSPFSPFSPGDLGWATATLDGGAGDDRLLGGAAPKVRLAGGPGADLLEGGAAEAVADYTASPAGVRVALGGRGAGGDAEGDELVGVEHVVGSLHADALTGDDGANLLFGEPSYELERGGADAVSGGGGADTLRGGPGRDALAGDAGDDVATGDGGADRVAGGDGNDRVAGSTGRDVVDGGPGVDRVDVADSRRVPERPLCGDGDDVVVALGDPLGADCERVDVSRLSGREASMPARPVRVGRRAVVLDVVCPAWPRRRCTLDVTLRARGAVLARQRLRRLRPGTHRTTFRVPPARLRGLERIGIRVRPIARYTAPVDTVRYSIALGD